MTLRAGRYGRWSPLGKVLSGRNIQQCQRSECEVHSCYNGATCVEMGASFRWVNCLASVRSLHETMIPFQTPTDPQILDVESTDHNPRTLMCTHARTHTCMHACTHARTHAHTHTHTHDPGVTPDTHTHTHTHTQTTNRILMYPQTHSHTQTGP